MAQFPNSAVFWGLEVVLYNGEHCIIASPVVMISAARGAKGLGVKEIDE